MKHKLNPFVMLLLGAVIALAKPVAAQQQQAPAKPLDPVGDFEFSTTVDGQTRTGVISITKKEDVLGGKIFTDMMPELPVSSVKVEGRTVTLNAALPDTDAALVITLTFEDDNNKFSGSWSVGADSGTLGGKRKTG
jgi:hypothetical protein